MARLFSDDKFGSKIQSANAMEKLISKWLTDTTNQRGIIAWSLVENPFRHRHRVHGWEADFQTEMPKTEMRGYIAEILLWFQDYGYPDAFYWIDWKN
jgi:hypothetical protein